MTEKHRIGAAWSTLNDGCLLLSAYFKDSEGLSPVNLDVLEQLAIIIEAYRAPWILAADFNMPPDLLAASGWLDVTQGSIVHTSQATCGTEYYDYFVVGGGVQGSVVKAQCILDANTYNPCGVRLLLRAGALRRRRRTLVKPTNFRPSFPLDR